MKYKELAEMLGSGYGQIKVKGIIKDNLAYDEKYDNEEIEGILIRPWGGTDWIEPNKEAFQTWQGSGHGIGVRGFLLPPH